MHLMRFQLRDAIIVFFGATIIALGLGYWSLFQTKQQPSSPINAMNAPVTTTTPSTTPLLQDFFTAQVFPDFSSRMVSPISLEQHTASDYKSLLQIPPILAFDFFTPSIHCGTVDANSEIAGQASYINRLIKTYPILGCQERTIEGDGGLMGKQLVGPVWIKFYTDEKKWNHTTSNTFYIEISSFYPLDPFPKYYGPFHGDLLDLYREAMNYKNLTLDYQKNIRTAVQTIATKEDGCSTRYYWLAPPNLVAWTQTINTEALKKRHQ